MKRTAFRTAGLSILFVAGAALTPETSWACGGTYRPNCGQTAWLAKFVTSNILLPGNGSDITVPIGLVPYVLWTPGSNCAQPSSSVVELTLTCSDVAGGSPIIIGPTSVPIDIPSIPGAQSVLTGAGGTPELGGPFAFPISGGTLPVGTSYSCLVEGEFTIGFSGGVGAPLITGIGDTEVCIVEPAPGDPSVPRFQLDLVQSGPMPFSMARRGDQITNHYLLTNNDPNQTLDLDITSTTNQIARMPMGDDPSGTLFALSDPNPDTDDFVQALAQDLPPGGILPLPDPTAPNPGLMFTHVLPPGDLGMKTIVTRPHGMCADGSCSEGLVKAVGQYGNGDMILGCAGTAFIVDDVPAMTPQCEVNDLLQTRDTVDTIWIRATFNGDPHASTHFAGNQNPDIFGSGTQTTGPILSEQFNLMGVPPTANDYLRTEIPLDMVSYGYDTFDQDLGFAQQHGDVNIWNLPSGDFNIRIPTVSKTGVASNLQVDIDLQTNRVIVVDQDISQQIAEEDLDVFLASPPAGLSVDNGSFREFVKMGPGDGIAMKTIPSGVAELTTVTDAPMSRNVSVLNNATNQPIAWSATSNTPLVTLSAPSGTAGQDIVVNWDPAAVALSPNTTLATITVTNPEALNSPVDVAVALRSIPVSNENVMPINAGHSGAYSNPATPGQGLLFEYLPDIDLTFLGLFTWDTTQPQQAQNLLSGSSMKTLATAQVGNENHRWLTAQGNSSGGVANLQVFLTQGGLFDDPTAVTNTADGTMTLAFTSCSEGTLEYNLTSSGLSGSIPLNRIANDNVPLCQSLAGGGISSTTTQKIAGMNDTGAKSRAFGINPGLNGAWFNTATPGQGYFLEVYPDIPLVFIAWFTYDTTQPAQAQSLNAADAAEQMADAVVGDENHRWLTAQGSYAGTTANLNVTLTTGGLFDDPAPPTNTSEGTMTLTFQDCMTGTIEYNFTAAGVSGSVPISRLANDNVALCESFDN